MLALGAGGYYVYENVELEAFGVMTAPAKDRQDKVEAGLKAMRAMMLGSKPKHWYWRGQDRRADRDAPRPRRTTPRPWARRPTSPPCSTKA